MMHNYKQCCKMKSGNDMRRSAAIEPPRGSDDRDRREHSHHHQRRRRSHSSEDERVRRDQRRRRSRSRERGHYRDRRGNDDRARKPHSSKEGSMFDFSEREEKRHGKKRDHQSDSFVAINA